VVIQVVDLSPKLTIYLQTKKKRPSRRVPTGLEDDSLATGVITEPSEPSNKMDIDQKTSAPPPDLDANFVDDEQLQAALSRSRRQKVRKAKISPEEIAQQSKPLRFILDDYSLVISVYIFSCC
jgi:hypothetical protein